MSFTWKRPEGRLLSPEDMMRVIIRVVDELGLPDKRGACIIGGMTVEQESDFWCPGNNADPCFAADPNRFPHDSMGNDGRSVGRWQQQTSGPPPATQWGWGGRYGDPEGTRKRMDPYESTRLFMAELKKRPYRASNAQEANHWAQDVQDSGVPDAYAKHWDSINRLYDKVTTGITVPPVVAPLTYGMPTGSNSGGYGNTGVKFPDWVYQLGNVFGLKPSTYPGHQESNRNEAGYAPNPAHLNRGIDWAAPGAPDEVDRMQRLADYLFSIRSQLEQVIWWNPRDGRRIGVAGGKDVTSTPYYDYPGGYDDHRNHVHTRQSHPIPLPGNVGLGGAPQAPVASRPDFTELDYYSGKKIGQGFNVRSRPAINVFIHTEQGNSDAKGLARYSDGSNGVSYHDTVRDGIVCHVVNPDYYCWAVLSANVFSINICFAGSYAEWTRAQWLLRERDIEIVAYLAAQYCRKYGIPTDVISPPYHEAPGISDHKYVTEQLHIGDHHDVGDNFPWDVFRSYVNKYASTQGDDELSAEAEALIRDMASKVNEMYGEWTKVKQGPTRSFLAPDAKPVDSPLGFLYNVDGNVWNVTVTWAYLFGVQRAEELVTSVARNGVVPESWAGQLTDDQGHWLAQWGQEWCLGLISFRAAIQKAFKALEANSSSAPTTGTVTTSLSQADIQKVADHVGQQVGQDVADQIARNALAPTPPAPETNVPAVIESTYSPDDWDTVADIGRSLEALKLADALPIDKRAPLAALISILQTKNGTQIGDGS